jgi:gluconate 2-dehydrogenase alpha chain
MPTRLKDTDVVIIGLGAAGGVAALPLAQAGLDVVGVEAGTWLTKRDFAPDELRNNFRGWPQAAQKANREIPTHRPNASSPPSPRFAIHPTMNAVGGTTLHYWAQSWRLNPWDFKVVSETTRRYGRSRIPAGSTVEDWPFGLEELEPFYDRVEREIGVSGAAGNIKGTIDRRGNIFEGARAREYPMPPLRGTGFTDLMAASARTLGWHPFPGPAAINSQRYQGRSACMYHGYCNRGGCHVDAKNSTAVTTIPRAQATGRLKIATRAHVTRIDVDGNGRVSGVTYVTDGTEYFQPARVVLLSSYTYENTRILLLSSSKVFPNGLSNNHGQVGRHYFSHAQTAGVTALFPWNTNSWYGLPAQGVAIDDWADDNFDHAKVDFIGGGNLWVYSDRRPIAAASMTTFGKTARSWGSDWKAFIAKNADRTNTTYLLKTTLPYESNYLDLDPEVKDPLGFPVCRITADYQDN